MTFQIDNSVHWTDHFVEHGFAKVEGLYDGSLDEFEFHMAGKPSRLKVGHRYRHLRIRGTGSDRLRPGLARP